MALGIPPKGENIKWKTQWDVGNNGGSCVAETKRNPVSLHPVEAPVDHDDAAATSVLTGSVDKWQLPLDHTHCAKFCQFVNSL